MFSPTSKSEESGPAHHAERKDNAAGNGNHHYEAYNILGIQASQRTAVIMEEVLSSVENL
jgi:hypothetical protein